MRFYLESLTELEALRAALAEALEGWRDNRFSFLAEIDALGNVNPDDSELTRIAELRAKFVGD